MNQKYFYRLGHCPELGVAEYKELTQDVNFMSTKSWMLSNKKLNTQKTGSLVFGGIVHKIFNEDFKIEELMEKLFEILSGDPKRYKKVGLVLPQELKKNGLELAKKAGCKKVNILNKKEPNFGNWKQTKKWIITFDFEDKIILGEIENFSNQEFWNNLDFGLPQADMKRGLINLKLARSLMNLVDSQNVWDPFCGLGRALVSALDLKDGFIASDLDQTCLPELQENYEKGIEIWDRHKRILFPDIEEKEYANLKKLFTLDAVNLNKARDIIPPNELKDYAIVTEGYLGKNFAYKPKLNEIENQWRILEQIWLPTLKEAGKLEIKELVFCLPFYPNFKTRQGNKEVQIPTFLDNLEKNSKYKFSKLSDKNYILYSREKSNTGHLVLKMELE